MMFLDNKRDQKNYLHLNTPEKAPFSIQNFVEHSFSLFKKEPGDWYGTNSASNILESLNTHYKPIK